MDTRLLALLVCPICKGPLKLEREVAAGPTDAHGTRQASGELICRADRLAFPIRDGIPVMLEEEARAVEVDAPPAPPTLLGASTPPRPNVG